MNEINLKNIAENLLDTFLQAGKLAKEVAERGVKITIKADGTPVTDGDLIVDKMIKKKLEKLTPDISIISEETVHNSPKNNDKNFWLIDPIDGTKDYIKNKDEYTLNAALIIDLQPVLGVIYAPKKDRLFYSFGSNNAFEVIKGVKKKLNCSKKTEKGKVFAVHNSNTLTPDILEIHKQYNVHSFVQMRSSFKFCVVAAGEADIYATRARAFEWDIAAGHAIVEHSGGSITTTSGKKIFYGKKDYKNPSIIVRRAKDLIT